MISFRKLGALGRLGNQLFQYAAIRSLSLKLNTGVEIPVTRHTWHGQKRMIDFLSIPEEFFVPSFTTKPSRWVENDTKTFKGDFFLIPNGSDVEAYLQNYLYFKDYEDVIRQELSPDKDVTLRVEEKLREYQGHELVSIHIRRPDLPGRKDCKELYGNDEGSINKNARYYKYLEKALDKLSDVGNKKFLVFTGGARSGKRAHDIEWCKKNINLPNVSVVEGLTDLEDLILMSRCDHSVMNLTTFGWWGSYLGYEKGKRVIAPRCPVYGAKHYYEGYYPEDWILIEE